jgi:hypothetical protein
MRIKKIERVDKREKGTIVSFPKRCDATEIPEKKKSHTSDM